MITYPTLKKTRYRQLSKHRRSNRLVVLPPGQTYQNVISLDTPIMSCPLKPRTVNVCLVNGISTVRHLTQMSSKDLIRMQYFGKNAMREILLFMHQYGFSLKADEKHLKENTL